MNDIQPIMSTSGDPSEDQEAKDLGIASDDDALWERMCALLFGEP